MRLELRMKYLEKIYQRYKKASKESKSKILDELCQICWYNCKYAIWKLIQLPLEEKEKPCPKRKRQRKYGKDVIGIVEEVWKKANYPWSLHLKEILRLWGLPWIKVRYRITPETEEKLLAISANTIDRSLKEKTQASSQRTDQTRNITAAQDTCKD